MKEKYKIKNLYQLSNFLAINGYEKLLYRLPGLDILDSFYGAAEGGHLCSYMNMDIVQEMIRRGADN